VTLIDKLVVDAPHLFRDDEIIKSQQI